jgi:iron(II)-dependent oxidoreductase
MTLYQEYANRVLKDSEFFQPIQFHDSVVFSLDQVYVPLLTAHTKEDDEARGLRAFKPKPTQDIASMPAPPVEYLSALEMVNRERLLVLLGESGQGKTTFLKLLTLCLLGEKVGNFCYGLNKLIAAVDRRVDEPSLLLQDWSMNDVLPIYLDLTWITDREDQLMTSFCSNEAFWSRIHELYPEIGNTTKAETTKLLLLDHCEALVDENHWSIFVERILALCHKDEKIRVVITNTHESYRNHILRPAGFIEEKILPFTLMQKMMYLNQIMGLENSNISNSMVLNPDEKNFELPMDFSIRWMAGDGRQSIPQSLLILIKRYLSKLGIMPEHQAMAEQALGFMALQDNQLPGFLAEKEIINAMLGAMEPELSTPEYLTRFLRNDAFLFKTNGTAGYAFRHPKLRDFFTAQYLRENQFPDLYLSLVQKDPLKWKAVSIILFNLLKHESKSTHWHLAEMILAAADKQMTEKNSKIAFLLASSLREDLGQISSHLMIRIQAHLQEILIQGWLSPYERDQAGRMLSILGDSRDLRELVMIPGGKFYMGNHAQNNAAPEHVITLPSYKIGKYPVTMAFYREFVDATQRIWLAKEQKNPERQNAPAVDVTWHDALAFCDWLTDQWQNAGLISQEEEVRLPTEAEWEYAARGNRFLDYDAPDPVIYPWSGTWQDDHCNSIEIGFNDTCVVGMFPKGASPFECLDMCGQVWEWTSTLWGEKMDHPDIPYPYTSTDGRECLIGDDGIRRVLRGGSFSSPYLKTSCTYRGSLEPAGFWRGDGFRIVVSKKDLPSC